MIRLLSNLKSIVQHYRMSIDIMRQLLKNPITVDDSIQIIKKGLKEREKNFLTMIKKCIFENPRSPYKALLDHAGYTFNDVEGLVNRVGLENSLKRLYTDGVYIDINEFKVKKPAVRGNKSFVFKESDFNNPLLSSGLDTQTGGSTGRSTNIRVPLEYIHHNAVYGIYASSLYGIPGKKVIIWLPILPALEGLFFNLRFGVAGNTPVKWFSHVDGRRIKPSRLERFKTASTIWLSRFYGIKLPKPEYIDIRDTVDIAKWMHQNLSDSSGYAVVTYASSAFRLVMEAKKEGINIAKTVFWLMGEPLTERKHREIESFGCKAYTLYGCNELMLIGHACINPEAVDDIHVCMDKLAVIQHERKVEQSDINVDAFLFTTLLDISPKIFLNTEVGDYGVMEHKRCGCPFDGLGFIDHIHSIRSFEKLTAEGMTFVGSNLIHLIEDLLPSRFGGNSTDYQFLEAEDEDGYTRLFLLISPDHGEVDENSVRKTIFEGLFKDVNPEYVGARAMRDIWSKTDTIQIRRMNPIPTKRGKIMPFYLCKEKVLFDKKP